MKYQNKILSSKTKTAIHLVYRFNKIPKYGTQ